MLELLKELPFTLGLAIAGAGVAAWFGARWWVILIALAVGFVVGATIDDKSKKAKAV